MNNERGSNQELNSLSAYLDNALTKSERDTLERRLKQETDLREKLEKLHKTKILLGSLPRLRAPRNFTLTPDMVDVRPKKQQPLFMFLRLASSLAALLLVVLFGFELLTAGGIQPSAQMAADSMMEAARVEDKASPEPLIIWDEPSVNGMGGGADEFAVEEPILEMQIAPDEPELEEPAEGTPETEIMPESDVDGERPPAEEKTPGDEVAILGINPEEGGEIIDRSSTALLTEDQTPSSLNILRYIQIALAVIAVGSGLSLWLLQKRQRA